MAAPTTGQVTLSGTAAQIAGGVPGAFTIKAPLSNVNPAYVGPVGVTTSTGYQLDPGDVYEYAGQTQNGQVQYNLNLQDFYAVGTAPDKVVWLGSR